MNLFVLQFLLDTDFHCRTFAIVGKVIEVKMVGNYKTNTNTTIRQIQIQIQMQIQIQILLDALQIQRQSRVSISRT